MIEEEDFLLLSFLLGLPVEPFEELSDDEVLDEFADEAYPDGWIFFSSCSTLSSLLDSSSDSTSEYLLSFSLS